MNYVLAACFVHLRLLAYVYVYVPNLSAQIHANTLYTLTFQLSLSLPSSIYLFLAFFLTLSELKHIYPLPFILTNGSCQICGLWWRQHIAKSIWLPARKVTPFIAISLVSCRAMKGTGLWSLIASLMHKVKYFSSAKSSLLKIFQ